jgi:superfamily II DNA or RNA helicase
MPRRIVRLSALASSHHDLCLAAFITNTAESEFSAHTAVVMHSSGQSPQDELALFREEFARIQKNSPFPWQERLFQDFCRSNLPSALDLPTGLGKTSVMTIWLLARSLADETNRNRIPRRLLYVVDRRAVVDQATVGRQHLSDRMS